MARIWSPYKEILQHVVNAIVRKQKDSLLDLEMTLRRNKTLFLNLLSNPVRKSVVVLILFVQLRKYNMIQMKPTFSFSCSLEMPRFEMP